MAPGRAVPAVEGREGAKSREKEQAVPGRGEARMLSVVMHCAGGGTDDMGSCCSVEVEAKEHAVPGRESLRRGGDGGAVPGRGGADGSKGMG
jgi:hypothetical protein